MPHHDGHTPHKTRGSRKRHSGRHGKQRPERRANPTYPTPPWAYEVTPQAIGQAAAEHADRISERMQLPAAVPAQRVRTGGESRGTKELGREGQDREAAEVVRDVGQQQGPEVGPRADSVDVITVVAQRLLDGVRQQINPK